MLKNTTQGGILCLLFTTVQGKVLLPNKESLPMTAQTTFVFDYELPDGTCYPCTAVCNDDGDGGWYVASLEETTMPKRVYKAAMALAVKLLPDENLPTPETVAYGQECDRQYDATKDNL